MKIAPAVLSAFALLAILASPLRAADGPLTSVFPPGSIARSDPGSGGFVVEDVSGHRTGALKPAANGYIIEDGRGRRIGTIEYDSAHDQWKIEQYALDGTVTSKLLQ